MWSRIDANLGRARWVPRSIWLTKENCVDEILLTRWKCKRACYEKNPPVQNHLVFLVNPRLPSRHASSGNVILCCSLESWAEPMKKLFWVLVLMTMVSCSSKQCDLVPQLQSRAGASAVDCGYAVLNGNPQPVDICVLDSFTTKAPFIARYDRRGKDSKVVFGLAGDAQGNVTFLDWDGDPSGGSGTGPVITGTECVGPTPDPSTNRNSYATPPLRCTSSTSLGRTCS
jgi:hypothetical protein